MTFSKSIITLTPLFRELLRKGLLAPIRNHAEHRHARLGGRAFFYDAHYTRVALESFIDGETRRAQNRRNGGDPGPHA